MSGRAVPFAPEPHPRADLHLAWRQHARRRAGGGGRPVRDPRERHARGGDAPARRRRARARRARALSARPGGGPVERAHRVVAQPRGSGSAAGRAAGSRSSARGLPRGRGEAAARTARALRLLGFADFARDLALRPDNLRGGVAAVREELHALGLPPSATVCALSELDAATEARARGLWDVDGASRGLRAAPARARGERGAARARAGGGGDGRVLPLGGRVIRELVLDPLLPEPLAPAAERRALVAAMRRYDRAGRRVWASFMARYGAPHAALPAHGERRSRPLDR